MPRSRWSLRASPHFLFCCFALLAISQNKKRHICTNVWRSKIEKDEQNIRSINAFIINSQGELLIPRRTATKKNFPLCLDMSCGGYVRSGETYEEALEREINEELNINIKEFSHREIGYLSPYKNDISMFMKIYEIESNDIP